MTLANESKAQPFSALGNPLRRCAVTVAAALATVARRARFHPRQPWLEPRKLALVAAATAAVFVFVFVFIDVPAIEAARRLPRWLISAFDWYTDFGKSGWFLWPLGILFLALAALPRNLTRFSQGVLAAMMVRVGFLFIAIGLPSLFAAVVKNMIGRARPFVGGVANPYLFDPFHWTPAYASLPSGHATTAFAVLAAFGSLWPRAHTALLIYALLIAASRVVVTAHHPTDVLAGALVGIVGVWLVRRYFALRGLAFSVGQDGILRQKPGPSVKRIKSVARGLLA
jgi:membrane-associated phospholipid phosphatase